jgi:hypothetical protein
MAFYDQNRQKVARNQPCPCGGNRKFKHCHAGSTINSSHLGETRPIPEHVLKEIQKTRNNERTFEALHGQGKPIITTEWNDWRFVAVGNELHYSKKNKTKYFPDFLGNYVRSKLSSDWGNFELQKPLEERHQILKWYNSMCVFQKGITPDNDGVYKSSSNGAMLSWYRLAYDLYLIKHNAELQEEILKRLRQNKQFQGARFELCVTASMISAGFEISFEDESDPTRKHAEFLAKNSEGIEVAVEAKSRHRNGVLDFDTQSRKPRDERPLKVSAERLIKNALAKEPGIPFIIFIDVNLPYFDEGPGNNPWFKEMSDTVKKIISEYGKGEFPANAIIFCNDSTYYKPDTVPVGQNFWCYSLPVDSPKYLLEDKELPFRIANAVIQRTNIPNEYPND